MVHLLSHNEYKAVLNKNKKKKNVHRSTRVYCPGRAYRSAPAYRLHERTVLYVRIELVLRLLQKKKETTTKKKQKQNKTENCLKNNRAARAMHTFLSF